MILFIIILAYLIGSIPISIWFGKIFFGKDIRKAGSGNAGTTNAFRVFGIIPALIILSLDILKGYLALSFSTDSIVQLFLAISVIIGHIFPIFANFKGGKGVATSFGCFLAINPLLLVIPSVIWLFTIFYTKISSIASLLSILSLLIYTISVNNNLFSRLFVLIL